jgi:ATP-dependent DNA helicase RecG
MSFSDDELLALSRQPESHFLERKESFQDKDAICKTICAFANDLAGSHQIGILFIGLRDDGSFANLIPTDDLLQKVDQLKSDGRIQPLPSLTTRVIRSTEGALICIAVAPSNLPPVRFNQRVWVRLAATTQQANHEDERILNERRRTKAGRSFDSEAIPTSRLDDLNLRYFKDTYLPSAIAPDVLEANGRTLDEQLVTTRMALGSNNGIKPTVAGLLTLAYSPLDYLSGAYVQFVRYEGKEQGGVILDQADFAGNLENIINATEAKIKAHITTALQISGVDREIASPTYPMAALQQLFRNAVLHRNYEGTNAPIRLYWFEDRIEIVNPGGPFGLVTQENFGKPYAADYRNPTIAEVLANLSFVQKFGFGIQSARRSLAENGNPPLNFEITQGFVLVTIYARKKS